MLGKLHQKCCDIFYLHPKIFNLSLKSNLLLTLVSCRGVVNASIPTFSNISLTQSMKNVLIAWRITQKMVVVISICSLRLLLWAENQVYIWRQFPVCCPVNPSNPILCNINLAQTNKHLVLRKSLKNDCNNLFLHSMAFNISYNQIHIWRQLPIELAISTFS